MRIPSELLELFEPIYSVVLTVVSISMHSINVPKHYKN